MSATPLYTPSEPFEPPFKRSHPWLLSWCPAGATLPCRDLVAAARAVPEDALSNLSARGFAPRARDAAADAALAEAQALIRLAPDLWSVVSARVEGIALVSSAGPDYDRSHSEQRWPGWIFVSLPPAGHTRVVRLAEQVIHEAMHFNPAALETEVPLAKSEGRIFSPWKGEDRAASGLLHALYVFTTLTTWFRQVARHSQVKGSARRRIVEIREEINTVDRVLLEACLTPAGLVLASSLFAEAELDFA